LADIRVVDIRGNASSTAASAAALRSSNSGTSAADRAQLDLREALRADRTPGVGR
jgi:hypothetical protein